MTEVGIFDTIRGIGADYVTIEKDSVTYGEAVTAKDGAVMDTATCITANKTVKVGQKLEFDLNLTAFKSDKSHSKAFFWLANVGTDMTKSKNALAVLQTYLYGTKELGAVGAASGTFSFGSEQVGSGNSLGWGMQNFHITFEVTDANTVKVTLKEQNGSRSWSKTVTTTTALTEAQLCFGTAGVGYKVSNLTVTEIG